MLNNSFQRQVSLQFGAAALGVGTRCRVIGAAREEDGGFRRIAPRIAIMVGGFPMIGGKTHMGGEAITDPTTIGVRSHIPIGAGVVPHAAGAIHSSRQAGI